jgi:hypothetical protein
MTHEPCTRLLEGSAGIGKTTPSVAGVAEPASEVLPP